MISSRADNHRAVLLTCTLIVGLLSARSLAEPVVSDLRDVTGIAERNLMTPMSVREAGGLIRIAGDSTSVRIAGRDVAVRLKADGPNKSIGLDLNANGLVDNDEWWPARRRGSIVVRVHSADGSAEAVVALRDTVIRSRGSRVYGGSVRIVNDMGLLGEIAGTPVLLLDDNMDGVIQQGGGDAVLIGAGRLAMPLRTVHQVNGRLVSLAVDVGDSRLSAAPLEGEPIGQVTTGLSDDPNAFAVVACDRAAFTVNGGAVDMPAGDYRLAFGLVRRGSNEAVIQPGDRPTGYQVRAGEVNHLALGPPYEITFRGSVSRSSFTVRPELTVLGAGGEHYAFAMPTPDMPTISLLDGDRVLDVGQMEYG